jgi:hypothetical protein
MTYHRREDFSGKPMLVTLPTDGYENTGEGGTAFYFVIPLLKEGNRCACIADCLFWGYTDCVIYPSNKYDSYPKIKQPYQGSKLEFDYYAPMKIDGGLLIGSTGLSLFSEHYGEYFHATYESLTVEGKKLYNLLKKLYGKIDIVTLLDT